MTGALAFAADQIRSTIQPDAKRDIVSADIVV